MRPASLTPTVELLPQPDLLETPDGWEAITEAPTRANGAVAGVAPHPVAERQGCQRHALRRADILLAVIFAVAALVARWPFIARGETLLHSDEAIVGIMAQDIAEGRRLPVYFYGQRYMGALEAYLIAALRPLFADPITSLRVGPACFFAALTALQFLMLTRWFGRLGGVVGAVTLLAASPMFVQWSISARGGYIEILVWGTLVWWTYSEWFVAPAPATRRGPRQAVLGALVGSGMWINPTIAVFVVPVVAHALLGRPLQLVRRDRRLAPWFRRLDCLPAGRSFALPVLLLVAIVALNCITAVWVEDGHVRYSLLLGVLPRPAALGVLALAATAVGFWLVRSTNLLATLRARLTAAAPMLIGVILGNTPPIVYLIQRTLSAQPLEDTLPLGLRPIWKTGETLNYLVRGLPFLFGSDPQPFLTLVRVGRSYATLPLSPSLASALAAMNWLVLAGLIAAGCVLFAAQRHALVAALRLRPGVHSPAVFLVLALTSLVGLYVMGGCTVDFTTIRYLIPAWAVLPGLFAAVVTSARLRWLGRASVCTLWIAWSAGQAGMFAQLGPPHPLRELAKLLHERNTAFALAEPLDAHLLSFLTQQQPPLGEFQSFWPRLGHYRQHLDPAAPTSYVVHAQDVDWAADWTRPGFPGPAPPETSRFLWGALRETTKQHPGEVLSRERLRDGYELWTLAHPLPERMPDEAR